MTPTLSLPLPPFPFPPLLAGVFSRLGIRKSEGRKRERGRGERGRSARHTTMSLGGRFFQLLTSKQEEEEGSGGGESRRMRMVEAKKSGKSVEV